MSLLFNKLHEVNYTFNLYVYIYIYIYIYVGTSYLWGIVEAVCDGPTAQ